MPRIHCLALSSRALRGFDCKRLLISQHTVKIASVCAVPLSHSPKLLNSFINLTPP